MGCLKLSYYQTYSNRKVLYSDSVLEPKSVQMWLSVDPMSDKYPSMSPYNYCANNPVILVDPDGEEIEDNLWIPDGKGGWIAQSGDDAFSLATQSGMSPKSCIDLVGASPVAEGTVVSPNNSGGYSVITPKTNTTGTVNPSSIRIKPNLEKQKVHNIISLITNGTTTLADGTAAVVNKSAFFMNEIKADAIANNFDDVLESSVKDLKTLNKIGKVCNYVSYAGFAISVVNTELQYDNNEITNFDRWATHITNGLGTALGPFGAIIPYSYEAGKKWGPSTWFK
jgi:hypothetical protein